MGIKGGRDWRSQQVESNSTEVAQAPKVKLDLGRTRKCTKKCKKRHGGEGAASGSQSAHGLFIVVVVV